MGCSANPGASVGVSDAINGIQASVSALLRLWVGA
jgi:beta-phosphoglucomutase-like phosphatase (HAD superfamily)